MFKDMQEEKADLYAEVNEYLNDDDMSGYYTFCEESDIDPTSEE